MNRHRGKIILGLAFVLLLALFGVFWPFELVFYVVLGWLLFLVRVALEVEVDWLSVCMALLLLGVFSVGLHLFLRWLFAEMLWAPSPASGDSSREQQVVKSSGDDRRWQTRWSVSIVTMLILLFMVGIACVGIAHQVSWWVTSPAPTFRASNAALRYAAQRRLRTVASASAAYVGQHGTFPAGTIQAADGGSLHGWMTTLLPYIDEQSLYDRIDLSLPWNDATNADVFREYVATYTSGWHEHERRPVFDAQRFALTDYAGNVHVLGGTRPMPKEAIRDGHGYTILCGEAFSNRKPWGHPVNVRDPALGMNTSENGFGAPWNGGVGLFVMVDGSVRVIPASVDPTVFQALATPNGGEAVNDEEW